MSILNKIILLFLLGSFILADASTDKQKMILEYSKNREYIVSKLTQAKYLSQDYNLSYTIEEFGEYFAITISPIETLRLQEALYILFRVDFPSLFYVHISTNNLQIQKSTPQQTTLLLESLEKVDEGKIINHLKSFHLWIEKWYILLLLFILGLYFYYKKVKKIAEIQKMQNSFEKSQEQIDL